MKTCTKCRIEKTEKEFYRNKLGRLESWCRVCGVEKTKNWSKNNPDKVKAAHERYREKREKEIKERTLKWRSENREMTNKWSREYVKDRLKRDPEFKIVWMLRVRLRNEIKTGNAKKLHSMSTLVGCTSTELREWLSSKFKKGMSWENHGAWHIDHVRPCASFDLTKEADQLACFHYTNLQPLWAADNLKKSDTWEPTIHTPNSHPVA